MKTILHVVDVAVPRETVCGALSSTDGLAGGWTRSVSGAAGRGEVIDFIFAGDFNPDMKVIQFEPPSDLGWRCVGGVKQWADNTFSFGLEDREGATRLRFQQDYATELSDDDYGSYNFNWGYYLESLRLYCETGRGKPFEASGP